MSLKLLVVFNVVLGVVVFVMCCMQACITLYSYKAYNPLFFKFSYSIPDFCQARETLLLVFVQDVRTSLLCDFDLVDEVFSNESAATSSNPLSKPGSDIPITSAVEDVGAAAAVDAKSTSTTHPASAAEGFAAEVAAPSAESKEMPTAPSTPQLIPVIHDTTFFVPQRKVRPFK